MFSTSVRRAAYIAPSAPITPCLSHLAPRAAVTSQTVRSRSHQRRFSSSKPASPPADGPNGVTETVPLARPEAEKKVRGGRKKSVKEDGAVVGSKTKQTEQAHHLPSVPSTQHISPTHISASDFFSLHRPISLTTSFPKPITANAFAQIFEPRVRANSPRDVISTLSSTLEHFDALTGSKKIQLASSQNQQWNEETDNVRAGITADSFRKAEVKHLDGVSEDGSVLQFPSHILSTFRPFNPPPAPVPQDPITAESLAAGLEAAGIEDLEPQQRTYTAVLTVEESTHANGEITYSAHSTPLMEQEEPETIGEPMRYIDRVKRRNEEGMWAISVKRQRKLKMKKHKYKKLMKRTRVLRRKLDRT